MDQGQQTPLLELLKASGKAESQAVPWSPAAWLSAPGGASEGRVRLATHGALRQLAMDAPKGIRRRDVDRVSQGPIDLLIASMAWGFGSLSYGPTRTAQMLDTEDVDVLVANIVSTVRTEGAGAGFSSLFKPTGRGIVYGLGVAMGTKLLYFACRGLPDPPTPVPLVYDRWVHAGLRQLPANEQPRMPGTGDGLPSPEAWVSQSAYENWCEWASVRANTANVTPDDVEYALFAEGNPRLESRSER